MKLDNQETRFSHFSCYMEPLEPTISAQIAKKPELLIFGLSQTTENAKTGGLNNRILEHDSGTRREAFKPMWLTLGDQRKTR